MAERILTLFGEEIIPEQAKPAGKARAKKTPEELQKEQEEKEEKEREKLAEKEKKEQEKKALKEEKERELQEIKDKKEQERRELKELKEQELQAQKEKKEQERTAKKSAAPAEIKEDTGDETKTEEEKVIILPEDWKGDKQYYTIGEVAKLFKVKTSHIRFWTNEFKLKVRTTRKGDRLYSPDQIKELRAIHHLVKERGFTLTGAKAKLKAQNKLDVETVDLKQSLQELRGKLVIIRNQLKPARKNAAAKQEEYTQDTTEIAGTNEQTADTTEYTEEK